MGLQIYLDEVGVLDEKLWLAQIPPYEVSNRIGDVELSRGSRTVILVNGANHDTDKKTLSFDPNVAKVLNLGTSDDTIIVGCERSLDEVEGTSDQRRKTTTLGPGDDLFLRHSKDLMSEDIAVLGERLLRTVREFSPGDLQQLINKPRKFVETPDNFWTVKIQPRVESYYITIRGRPERYKDSSFEVKSEMASYSRFYLEHESEISEAVKLISMAKQM